MSFLSAAYWPIWLAWTVMGLAAVINLRTLRVPNWLSFGATVTGWAAALAVSREFVPSAGGGLVPSATSALLGGLLLVPFYASGSLGAGCVKMQAAFGAWVGCCLPLATAAWLTAMATVAGGLLTEAGAWGYRRKSRLAEAGAPTPVAFPAQVTLSLGAIGGSIALLLWDPV